MSEGTLFRYFPTKMDLVAASLERALLNHLLRGAEQFSALTRPIDLRTVLEGLWDLLSHPQLRWTYELISAAGADSELRVAIEPVLEWYAKIADAAGAEVLRELGTPENMVEIAIDSVTWAMQALVTRNMGRGDSWTSERLIDCLVFTSERAF